MGGIEARVWRGGPSGNAEGFGHGGLGAEEALALGGDVGGE